MDLTVQKRVDYALNLRRLDRSISNVMLSFYLTFFVTVGFLAYSADFLHWFVIPVAACGVLIGIDLATWLRRQIDTFDPVGMLGLFGYHAFFLAPMLHVAWQKWLIDHTPPADWREWLGLMAILNFLGLIVYRYTRGYVFLNLQKRVAKTMHLRIDGRRFYWLLAVFLFISAATQVWIYIHVGGFEAFIERAQILRSFEGFGMIFTISEAFPILLLIGYAYWRQGRPGQASMLTVLVFIAVGLALILIFGGLKTSRSNVIFPLFWVAGIAHFSLRPIPRYMVFAGLIFLVAFMFAFGLYKSFGLEGVAAFQEPESTIELAQEGDRTPQIILLRDLSRTNIQAYILYRAIEHSDNFDYALGRSYVGDAAILIPRQILPERPPNKVFFGTEAQFGRHSYDPERRASAAVYGLAGEAILNFGPLSVPIFFVFLGLAVGYARFISVAWRRDDSRIFLLPMLVIIPFVILTSDLDNLIFFTIKHMALPVAFLLLSSRIVRSKDR